MYSRILNSIKKYNTLIKKMLSKKQTSPPRKPDSTPYVQSIRNSKPKVSKFSRNVKDSPISAKNIRPCC